MTRPVASLRRQLVFSHLAAIAFTIISMVGVIVLVAGNWFAAQQGELAEPAQEARMVARAIGGLMVRGQPASELNSVLRVLARGDLQVLNPPGIWAPAQARHVDWFGPSLRNVAYIVVIGDNGQTLASSDTTGAAFAPPELAEWHALSRAAQSERREQRQLVAVRSGDEPAALGAYPILDDRGQPIAAVLVAARTLPPSNGPSGPWQAVAFFGAASVAVLAAASVFALISASIVGYFLSRRLVRRLERLGLAAQSLAAGDLSRRVDEGPADDVGQLARQFNHMADRLEGSFADLEAAKLHAENALRTKRELVANVSHELRTPLALIRGHVESLLMRGYDADGARLGEYLPVIHRESEQLSRLIDDLFVLSTTEAGALPLQLEPVSLAGVIEEVASSIVPIAKRERQVTVVTSIAAGLPPALADRRRVVQVLGNLVRNALRHTPEGGLIAVRAEQQDGRVAVTVEDTGEGIPADRLPHIFERFYRGDDARDRASGGAGLGLAIVRELVEAMGGDVSVDSSIGSGSRFSFRLAIAGDPAGVGHTSITPTRPTQST